MENINIIDESTKLSIVNDGVVEIIEVERGSQGERGIQGSKGDTGLQGVHGLQGADGATGIQGIQGIQGEMGINWLGDYVDTTVYMARDAIFYNGSSYYCILESTGNLPTNTMYWKPIALKGVDSIGVGDMLKATYDANNDGVVDNAEKVGGFTVGVNVPIDAVFTDTVYTHPASHAISVITGLQTALDDKVDDAQVLTNVPLGAVFTDTNTIYTHPTNHAPSIITQNTTNRFVTDTEKSTWNAKQAALGFTPENIANKGIINGYASLGADGLVPSAQLPSYVDDVLEVSNFATLPATGETGKIYVTLDTNKTYRWSGSAYVYITSGAVDSVSGKTGIVTLVKADVGLSNVDNTSDVNKPISTLMQTALNGKADDTQVLTNVPLEAVFTDTVYTHPSTHPASIITIADAGGLITATDVEGALQEASIKIEQLGAGGSASIKVVRFVIGTSTAGWTAGDCDYLCDGTADDAEINAAVTALPIAGGEVLILDGTYNIASVIKITSRSNISIRGNGNATILKRMYDSTAATNFGSITLTTATYCCIKDLQFDGNKATYIGNYNFGIYVSTNSHYTTILGNTSNNSSSTGIYVRDSNGCITSGNITSNNTAAGIRIYTVDTTVVSGNTSNNNNNIGYDLTYFNNSIFSGNTSNNNSGRGIYLGRSDNSTFSGNTINGNVNKGIYVDLTDNSTIAGNTCYNNDYDIYLTSSKRNTITGNACIRGTGLSTDYYSLQYTILLHGLGNNNNLISSNQCMGKAVVIEGGTSNTEINNKFA